MAPNICVSIGEAVGKSSLVPVPYDLISKDPSSVVIHGLPDGITLRKPAEYDTKTLMKILEQSNRIRFSLKRYVWGVWANCSLSCQDILQFWQRSHCIAIILRNEFRRMCLYKCFLRQVMEWLYMSYYSFIWNVSLQCVKNAFDDHWSFVTRMPYLSFSVMSCFSFPVACTAIVLSSMPLLSSYLKIVSLFLLLWWLSSWQWDCNTYDHKSH